MKIYNYNIMEIREKCGCYSWDEIQPACPAGKVGWKQTGWEALCPGSLQILAEEGVCWYLVAD